jgi:putative ABC transport system permease protein
MRRVRAWFLRLGGLFDKERPDRDLAEELESHLQMHIEDNLRLGMTPEEARRDALIKLGGMESVKEAYRDRRGVPWLESLIQDLRYSARMLRKNPGFTMVVVVTLALGIGVNTAIFSLINAVMLRPPPYPDPDQLVQVMIVRETPGYDEILDTREALAWQKEGQVFSQFGLYHFEGFNMTGGDEPARVNCGDVSVGFLPALGVRPALGRVFAAEEDRPGGPAVAILSHGLWQRRFGGDTNVLGKAITIDQQAYTVVGVLPASFQVPAKYTQYSDKWDVLRPLGLDEKGHGFLLGVGRLKPDVNLEQARASLDLLYQPFRDPQEKGKVALVRLQGYMAREAKRSLLVFQGAVGFILLIACANVANLLLARATRRRKELVVRVALGAGRLRTIRQLLTESLLLALLGAAFGVLLGWGIKDAVRSFLPSLKELSSVSLDGRVLAFTLLVALLTGLIFGLAPALGASRVSLSESLKEGSRSLTGGLQRHRLRRVLIVSEVALALVLLVGAGLLVKCFFRLRGVDPGFRTDRLLCLSLSLSTAKYTNGPAQAAYFQQVIEGLRTLPGVEAIGADLEMPFVGQSWWPRPGEVNGKPVRAFCSIVNPDYARALGIPLKSGRWLTEGDRAGSAKVVVVNESFVRLFLSGKEAVGQQIKYGDQDERTIVGVVGDVRTMGPMWGPAEHVYVCYLQEGTEGMGLALRIRGDPMALAAATRARIRAVDPDQPVGGLMTMEQYMRESLIPQWMNMWLSSGLGALALALATVGIYGVMSFTVSQRTHEIGVRMALGAQTRDVLKLVVGQGLRLTVVGLGVGLLAAFGLTRFLSSLLYGVSAIDLSTFVSVSLLLGGISLLACYLPARRATKVAPWVVLRYE